MTLRLVLLNGTPAPRQTLRGARCYFDQLPERMTLLDSKCCQGLRGTTCFKQKIVRIIAAGSDEEVWVGNSRTTAGLTKLPPSTFGRTTAGGP